MNVIRENNKLKFPQKNIEESALKRGNKNENIGCFIIYFFDFM